jgi:hypothetical protein
MADKKRLGDLLIDFKLITKTNLDEALRLQVRGKQPQNATLI